MKYNHVLALNPYFGHGTAAMGIFPPTGLEYIAANMEDLVGRITLVDLRYQPTYQDPAALSDFIKSNGVDLVCVSISWSSQYENVCNFIAQLPADVDTVVGGYKATLEVEDVFKRCPNVDMIVRGEGENIIRQIVNDVSRADILGLSWRREGQIVHNENQELPDIAQISFPDRLLRAHDYTATLEGIPLTRHRFDTILTTRGCPFNCKFCTFSLNPLGQKRNYTERPVESVIEELKTITADIVLVSDDNFFTNLKRSERLCDLIIENGIEKTFVVQARVDIARHRHILDKAEKAGFRVFLIGIESPHDRILEQLNKGITQQQIREAFEVLTQYDFYLHGYFIYGNIGESEEEMLYIPRFAKELNLDSISFQKLRIEKFSPLKEIVDNTPGYCYARVGGSVYSDRYGRKELKRIRNKIRSSFYDLGQVHHIAKKAGRLGIFTTADLLRVLPRMPQLTYRLCRREKTKQSPAAPVSTA